MGTARQIVRLREEGLSVEEIGETLGLATAAVKGALLSEKKESAADLGFTPEEILMAKRRVADLAKYAEKEETSLRAAELILKASRQERKDTSLSISDINKAIESGVRLARLYHEMASGGPVPEDNTAGFGGESCDPCIEAGDSGDEEEKKETGEE